MKRFLPISFFFAAVAWPQSAIAPPQVGFVQSADRSLRPVYGLASNFILGPPVAGQTSTQAFSGSVGLQKTDSSLVAFDTHGNTIASTNAAPGPALFAFSPDGAMALAYIASNGTLIEWRAGRFHPVSVRMPRESVVAIAFPNPSEARLFVEKDVGITETRLPLLPAGSHSQAVVTGVTAPLLPLPSGDLVYSDSNGIVIRRPDASEVRIAAALPASFSLQQMNRDWVQLSDLQSDARFAIHAASGREAYYQLPEARP
jgi:hypothetical protein